jgi:hypothetical protein
MKLSLCLTSEALRHEGVWGSGCIDQRVLDLSTSWSEWSVSRPGRFTPGTQWIGGWAGPKTGMDDVEERNLTPTGTRIPTPWPSSP